MTSNKPCGHCNSKQVAVERWTMSDLLYRACCLNCGARGPKAESEEVATMLWNQRTDSDYTTLRETMERVEAARKLRELIETKHINLEVIGPKDGHPWSCECHTCRWETANKYHNLLTRLQDLKRRWLYTKPDVEFCAKQLEKLLKDEGVNTDE